jgi:hypothetical protein
MWCRTSHSRDYFMHNNVWIILKIVFQFNSLCEPHKHHLN